MIAGDVQPHEDPASSCAALARTIDWARTPLGPEASWPRSLKGFLAMVLEMPTPAIVFWGPEQIQLYNDGYSVIMGPRHPRHYGAPYRECWPDTAPVILPWMARVLAGEVIEVERALFTLTRHGFHEEAYFTFTFSPLRDDTGAIAGVFQPVVEVTSEVLRERRTETLRTLARPGGATADALVEVARANPQDLPFAAFYGRDERGELQLRASTGRGAPESPPAVVRAVHAGRQPVVRRADELLEAEHVGVWGEPTREVLVVPVSRSGSAVPHGVVVFGISPRLRFDDTYRAFFETIARELAAALDAQGAARAEKALLARAEAARAEAEAERRRLHSVFVQAPVAITILVGPDYVVEMANPLTCRMWAREPHEVLDKPLLEALPELEGQGLEELLDRVRETRTPYAGTEWPVRIRNPGDGTLEEHFFNFVYDPLVDAAGEVLAVIVVATDVTIHVRARQAAERLAAELEQARDVAQRANRAKDEFLALLGHELRNPLAPIFTALELARLRDPAAASREHEVIERQARHLAALVDDLLDVSRITSGKIELKRQRIELSDVVAKAVETASPLFEQRRHELEVDLVPGLLVFGDAARLTQVFANLLANAAKYTDPGGRIVVAAHREAGEHVVRVGDTGCGISSDMLPRIFELFVQEPQKLDRAQGGLGLGLALVKSLVTLHGGTVEARSDGAGRGSTFVVRLPVLEAGAGPEVTARSGPLVPMCEDRAQEILIVDDNEDAAELLAETLAELGYACTVAHDGPHALELAAHHRYDAVLLDIGLPALDGYEVARHVRALPGWGSVPLVAITGYGQRSDRERSKAAGFDHHLVKPVDIRALTRLLHAELRTAAPP